MWVGITHFVPSSILSFVTFMTGFYGLAASEFHIRFWNPQQQAQSTQQQAQMMIDNLLASCSLCLTLRDNFAELC